MDGPVMQRFKSILVFTNSGPRVRVVLERAVALTKRNGAQLTALSVLESLPRELQRLSGLIHPADLWEVAVLERQQKLDGLVARSWNKNLNFTTKVLGGLPSIEVIKEVLRRNHDLVLMAAEGEV